MRYPARWGLPAALIGAICAAMPATALELAQSTRFTNSAPEYTQAADLQKGQMFMTSGLVCDRPSEVDAVITLARRGEALEAALQQINAGSEVPRCIVGKALFGQYLGKAKTFSVNEQRFHVHQVEIIGVAIKTPGGIAPMRLQKPIKQYVVSTDNTVAA